MSSSPIPLPRNDFAVNVCAEVAYSKLNLQLLFPGLPSLHSLHQRISKAFTLVSQHIINTNKAFFPSNSFWVDTAFSIGDILIYSKDANRWVELKTDSQLESGCQLYAFQQDDGSMGATDSIVALPAPICGADLVSLGIDSPTQLNTAKVSAPDSIRIPVMMNSYSPQKYPLEEQQLVIASTAAPPNRPLADSRQLDIAKKLFELLDVNKDGVVSMYELRGAMLSVGMDVTETAVGHSLSIGDIPIVLDQFRNFYAMHTKVATELHSKLLTKGVLNRFSTVVRSGGKEISSPQQPHASSPSSSLWGAVRQFSPSSYPVAAAPSLQVIRTSPIRPSNGAASPWDVARNALQVRSPSPTRRNTFVGELSQQMKTETAAGTIVPPARRPAGTAALRAATKVQELEAQEQELMAQLQIVRGKLIAAKAECANF